MEAQHLALEAKATLLDTKLRPLLDTLVQSFEEAIAVLNHNSAFGGVISHEVFEVKGPLTTAHSEFKPASMGRVPVMLITFPSGSKWSIYLPFRTTLESSEYEGSGEVQIRIDGDKISATIWIIDNQYAFRPDKPSKDWPIDIFKGGAVTNNVGGEEYLQRVIKVLFEQEMRLT